jgi:hypothetical protein
MKEKADLPLSFTNPKASPTKKILPVTSIVLCSFDSNANSSAEGRSSQEKIGGLQYLVNKDVSSAAGMARGISA